MGCGKAFADLEYENPYKVSIMGAKNGWKCDLVNRVDV